MFPAEYDQFFADYFVIILIYYLVLQLPAVKFFLDSWFSLSMESQISRMFALSRWYLVGILSFYPKEH